MLVRSGARVPADGIVTDGEAEVDESMITGESRPVPKAPGDRVVAGTVATDSALRVRVDAVGEDTALAGIRRLVEQAQASRSRAQALADRAAALLFYFATVAGLITFVTWLALGSPTDAVERTVTVLVIACPHALGLAIPLVIALSTGLSARAGILVKDRIALERMRTVNAVLFDKTGTLTKGQPAVIDMAAVDDTDAGRQRLLALAGAVEADSEHPLARAIVTAAKAAGATAVASDFRSLTGRGVQAVVDGPEGRRRRPGPAARDRRRGARRAGRADPTVVGPGRRGALRGGRRRDRRGPRAGRRDPPRVQGRHRRPARPRHPRRDDHRRRPAGRRGRRPGARRRRGVRRGAARGQGLQGRRAAGPGPAGGHGRRRRQRRPGPRPGRRRLAIGAGTDVAIESAGVVLASDDPRAVLGVITLSRASYRKMIQNLAWATGYNLISVPLAAGVLASDRDRPRPGGRSDPDERVDHRRGAQRPAAAPGGPAPPGTRLIQQTQAKAGGSGHLFRCRRLTAIRRTSVLLTARTERAGAEGERCALRRPRLISRCGVRSPAPTSIRRNPAP